MGKEVCLEYKISERMFISKNILTQVQPDLEERKIILDHLNQFEKNFFTLLLSREPYFHFLGLLGFSILLAFTIIIPLLGFFLICLVLCSRKTYYQKMFARVLKTGEEVQTKINEIGSEVSVSFKMEGSVEKVPFTKLPSITMKFFFLKKEGLRSSSMSPLPKSKTAESNDQEVQRFGLFNLKTVPANSNHIQNFSEMVGDTAITENRNQKGLKTMNFLSTSEQSPQKFKGTHPKIFSSMSELADKICLQSNQSNSRRSIRASQRENNTSSTFEETSHLKPHPKFGLLFNKQGSEKEKAENPSPPTALPPSPCVLPVSALCPPVLSSSPDATPSFNPLRQGG